MPDLEDKPEYMGQPPYPTEMHKAADKHDVPKLEQLLADGAEGVEVKDVLNQARDAAHFGEGIGAFGCESASAPRQSRDHFHRASEATHAQSLLAPPMPLNPHPHPNPRRRHSSCWCAGTQKTKAPLTRSQKVGTRETPPSSFDLP